MLSLVLDTSGPDLALGLWREGQRSQDSMLAQRIYDSPMQRSEHLAQATQEICGEVGVGTSDIARLLVGLGPGSFTGLRAGLAFAKGFQWGAALPCFGFSSLALRALSAGGEGPRAVLLDARQGRVFLGAWKNDASTASCLFEDACLPREEAEATIERLGPSVEVYAEGRLAWEGSQPLPSWSLECVAALREDWIEVGPDTVPRYLRASTPEEKKAHSSSIS